MSGVNVVDLIYLYYFNLGARFHVIMFSNLEQYLNVILDYLYSEVVFTV